ncbi:hypothetical protein GWR56_17935 [Mucilaginibacter sp. 14171R-50]|uniref:hypothetical protein n=1 Tax=Mucilaginibacter sp. 14171R-50 TaxID=2703789 RepID=UPI00138BBD26|nr:hypothetical protein [Mucilaginibacter sp. 14171R-50]QHS57328.1 hypothetical protein GWR56_17935 [Mucilaginibacter sp. 14171R-50]
MKKTIIYIALGFLIPGCHPFDNSIYLLNRSNLKITEYHEVKALADTAFSCADCTLTDSINPYFIPPMHKGSIFIDKIPSLKRYLKSNPDKRLMVYIFNADTCLKYRKDPEVLKNKVLKLMVLSDKDLLEDSTIIAFDRLIK